MGELLREFLDSQFLVYMLFFYLLCLVFYFIYSMLNYFKYYSRMRKTLQSLYQQMSDQEKQRAQSERQQRDIHGAGGKKDFLASIDEKLAYSGIKEKLPWMTTEIWILTMILSAVVIGTIAVIANGLIGVVLYAIIPIMFELVLIVLTSTRSKKTESQMLQFMNILDNFSRTSDDLISILEKASRYIEDPLGSQIYDAVIAARNIGNTQQALVDLQDSVKNKHFKVLIRNLEISSRFETNYSDIVEDCRELFHSYIQGEKEKRSIRQTGLVQVIFMMGMGLFCISMLANLSDSGSILSVFTDAGLVGMIVLGILMASYLISTYILVFKILAPSAK